MLVATEGTTDVTAVTLLAGVEPLLEAPAASQNLLSNWSMGSGGAGAKAEHAVGLSSFMNIVDLNGPAVHADPGINTDIDTRRFPITVSNLEGSSASFSLSPLTDSWADRIALHLLF